MIFTITFRGKSHNIDGKDLLTDLSRYITKAEEMHLASEWSKTAAVNDAWNNSKVFIRRIS